MLRDNHQKSVCTFAEPLISYLYGEICAAEKVEFETHLRKCSECRNALAEFGLVRSAVHEWRVEEFDILPTPLFELPLNKAKVQTATSEPRSWFAGWRQIFAFRPALAMSVSAIVIVLFVAAFLIFSRHSDQEIAGTINNVGNGKIAVSPTVEKTFETSKTPETARVSPAIVESDAITADKKSSATKIQTVRVTPNQTRNISGGDASLKTVRASGRNDEKPNVTPKSTVPHLIETDDEEDDSVRLADLFDEIGTR